MKLKNFSVLALSATMVLGMAMTSYASPAMNGTIDNGSKFVQQQDNRTDPLTTKQLELKKQGLNQKIEGKEKGKSVKVAPGQYVELERQGEGEIWTVLGEYSDLKHNTMPQPNRKVDNTTLWVPDFSRQHYLDLLFNEAPGANSMRNFYKEQSSNLYSVNGDVTDWVTVGSTQQYDDTNDDRVVWNFLQDEINAWYAQQKAAGKSDADINAYLSQFDKWDRYDYDGDGNFDEPDGYIDTFQAVHAGPGEEAGAPSWAIWSHSWYARSTDQGKTGPDFNKLGGIRIGDSNFWVGKYTVQPENGGVGVFTHEFGHDLGLPDLYDTSGGENGTGFWTLMSSGSWLGDGTQDIGSMAGHMGAWEKLQLGWLTNYEVADPSQSASYKLGPMEYNNRELQALFVKLPKKSVTVNVGTPYAGSKFYYSNSGNNLNNYMYKSFNLPEDATFSAKVNYDIESGYDYAYLIYSTDNGATWKTIQTNLSESEEFNFGISGSSKGQWVDLTANLPAGENVLVGFRYYTDGGLALNGFMVDDINITGNATFGAEAEEGWTFAPATGFRVTTGTETKQFNNYYVAEYRTYNGYDATLKTGPYFFGYTGDKADYVDHFPYQDGLLINYWDMSQPDNNTKVHPGQGLILPIDAHYTALKNVNGNLWRNRVQSYDATFTLSPTDKLDLHVGGVLSTVSSQKAVKVFDDRTTYWDPANPRGSVKNPNTGTSIAIQSIGGAYAQIQVGPAK